MHYIPYMVNTTFNACDILDNATKNWFAKFMFSWIQPHSNFDHPCPYSVRVLSFFWVVSANIVKEWNYRYFNSVLCIAMLESVLSLLGEQSLVPNTIPSISLLECRMYNFIVVISNHSFFISQGHIYIKRLEPFADNIPGFISVGDYRLDLHWYEKTLKKWVGTVRGYGTMTVKPFITQDME